MGVFKVEIPLKLPSCNDYIDACRSNRYKGAKMKADIEEQIAWFVKGLPRFEKPVKIQFDWIEGNKRRDLDGISFGKKFILDTLVKCGVLQDDNRKCVTAFTDTFSYGDDFKVILYIQEVTDDRLTDHY